MKIKNLVASAVLASGLLSGISAQAEMIDGLPDAIRCGLPSGGTFILYLGGRLNDGKIVYFSPVGEQQVYVTAEGVVEREGAECHGKSLEELRKDGAAFDFVK